MYRLVIADDEELILQGLRNVIDWTSAGFEVVGCYENGEAVLSHLNEDAPDAILADIKMPIMDGLTLLRRLREDDNQEIEFVFLTGYDDFELIQSAMRLNAQDYVLKPSSPEEILDVFSRVRARMEQRIQNRHRKLSLRLDENRVDMMKAATDMIFSRSRSMYERFQADYDLKIRDLESDAHIVMALLSTRNAIEAHGAGINEIRSLEKLRSHATDVENRNSAHIFMCSTRYYVTMVFLGAEQSSIKPQLETLCMQNEGKSDFVFIWEEVKESLWETHDLLFHKLFAPEVPEKYLNLYYSAGNDTALFAAAEDHDTDILKWCVQAGIARIRDVEDVYRRQLLLRMIYSMGISQLAQIRGAEEKLQVIEKQVREMPFETSASELLAFVQGCFTSMTEAENLTRHYHLCLEIAHYIRKNYAEEITLNDLSERFYISPNYLGNQFRRNLGIGIREFQTRVRMDKAEELIAEHRFRLYQIAEMIGYKNYEHFRKTYAKLRGHNPSEE